VAALYFGKMHFDPKALKDPDGIVFWSARAFGSDPIRGTGGTGRDSPEEMGKLKTIGGILQGHPDMMTPGMEAVTGSLGQDFR